MCCHIQPFKSFRNHFKVPKFESLAQEYFILKADLLTMSVSIC